MPDSESTSQPRVGLFHEIFVEIARHLPQEHRSKLVSLQKATKDPFQRALLRDVERFSLDYSSKPLDEITTTAAVHDQPTRILTRRLGHSDRALIDGANSIRSLVTASLDTFDRLGEKLSLLEFLVYKVDLSPFTGRQHHSSVSYSRILETGFLSDAIDPGTSSALREWAQSMLQLNVANPSKPILRVLQRNPRLVLVSLQVQPDHNVVEIIAALGELRCLRKLCVEGSNVVGGTPITLHNPTDVVLHILHSCQHLQELVYSDLPRDLPLPVFHISADFMSNITRLDLSGIRRGQWTTTLPVESGCHEIVLRCPDLQWLSFPRDLTPQEVTHLKTRLAEVCYKLTQLVFTESTLIMAGFSELLASYATLTHITFSECFVTPESLQRWAASPIAITTIEQVHITYGLIGEEMARDVLKMLHSSPIGTIGFDSSKKIASWKRSFPRHARQQS
ncbi:hypothetical protein B0O80DRAFT_431460 [Mortierella sp. GBAus27b]|nr:hypothetical protein B0O80DRAFT_431460 [Mortierella sp. GBAus27b]